MKQLTLPSLKSAARDFAANLSVTPIPELFGVTDGKAVGTYVEQGFHQVLKDVFSYALGNSASGIDFPELGVDVKVTSIRQPQSSCPFRDASQKVYGLGYHLLVFVYEKFDDPQTRAAFDWLSYSLKCVAVAVAVRTSFIYRIFRRRYGSRGDLWIGIWEIFKHRSNWYERS